MVFGAALTGARGTGPGPGARGEEAYRRWRRAAARTSGWAHQRA
jgi:hypothetical protein